MMITAEIIQLIESEKSDKYARLICPITTEVIQDRCVKIQEHFYTLSDILTALNIQRKAYFENAAFNEANVNNPHYTPIEFDLRLPTREPFPDDLLALMLEENNLDLTPITNFLTQLSNESQKEYGKLLEAAAIEVLSANTNHQPTPPPIQAFSESSAEKKTTQTPKAVQSQIIIQPAQRSEPTRTITPPQSTMQVTPEQPVLENAQPIQPPAPQPQRDGAPQVTSLQTPATINQTNNHSRLLTMGILFLSMLTSAFASTSAFVYLGGLEKLATFSNAAASLLGLGKLAAVGIIGSSLLATWTITCGITLSAVYFSRKANQEPLVRQTNTDSWHKKLLSMMKRMPSNDQSPQPAQEQHIENNNVVTTRTLETHTQPSVSTRSLRI